MGSRLRENPEKLFEVFVEVANCQEDGTEPFILQKFPPQYDEQDVLQNIPKFAFPCKSNTLQVDQFAFVLTDLESMYRFGYCRHGTGATTCLCIISHLPWFEVIYKMLNFLAEIINRSVNNDLLPFLKAAYEHSVPMPDEPVTIVAGQDMFTFTAPDLSQLPSIPASRNLTEYYNAVDTHNMMKLFASMLQERRIIITSKKLSRVTACIHASEALLYPMHWQHLYIPVLPYQLVDYVTAPMPYLIGVHTSLMEKIRKDRMEIGDAVIVDADKNEIESQHDDLDALPEDVLAYLKGHLKPKKVQTSMMDTGDAISKAFLQALVRLIGGYRDALKFRPDEDITFDRDAFVQSRPSQHMQVFLESMLQLQIFQQFINGRLILLNDGEGFHDLFEQESIKYADSLNTQSKYKEWLSKQKRKIKAQGRDIFSDMKDKAGPIMSTAVHNMKIQSKKFQSKMKEAKQMSPAEADYYQINENKMSSRKVSGGVVHSRNRGHSHSTGSYDRRPTTILGSQLSTSRPPRPPPPGSNSSGRPRTVMGPESRGKIYKTLSVEEGYVSHDDSNLRLSYQRMDMSLMTDQDIESAMMRSASAEILAGHKSDFSHVSNHLHVNKLSFTASDGDISDPSSEALSPSDDNLTHIPYVDLGTTAGPPAVQPPISSSEEDVALPSMVAIPPSRPKPPIDRLIVRDRPIAGTSKGSLGSAAGPPPVAPPRHTRRTGGEDQESPRGSPQLPRPVPLRRTSLDKKSDPPETLIDVSGADTLPVQAPLQLTPTELSPEKMLIKFESSESETDISEQFDPLRCGAKWTGPEESPAVSPTGSPGLNRTRISRNSLMRTEAFRRSPPESPLRPSYRDDTTPEREEGKKDAFADLFDPLAVPRSRSAVIVPADRTQQKDSLLGDWTYEQLAGSSGFSCVPSGGKLTCPVPCIPAVPSPVQSAFHPSPSPVSFAKVGGVAGAAVSQASAAFRTPSPARPPQSLSHSKLHHTGLLEDLVSVDIGSGLRLAATNTRSSHSLPRGVKMSLNAPSQRSSSPVIPRNLSNSSLTGAPNPTNPMFSTRATNAAATSSSARAPSSGVGSELLSSASRSVSPSPSQPANKRQWETFD